MISDLSLAYRRGYFLFLHIQNYIFFIFKKGIYIPRIAWYYIVKLKDGTKGESKMMNLVINTRTNETMDFEAAVMMMDDEIRESINNEMAPCTDQEFMSAYVEAHFEKYGEEFTI